MNKKNCVCWRQSRQITKMFGFMRVNYRITQKINVFVFRNIFS